jgi:methylthioribulose 1-phosphate dehydratase/enolase-phosphatase E1
VGRHGVYVWGKDWIQAKTQAECYDYLFEAAVRMRTLGIDPARPPAAALATPSTIANGHNGFAGGTCFLDYKLICRSDLLVWP